MSSNSGGGIRFSNIGNSLINMRVIRTDKYDNDPYRDNVVLHLPLHNSIEDVSNYKRAFTLVSTNPTISNLVYARNGGSMQTNRGGLRFPNANYMNLNQDFTFEFWINQYGIGASGSNWVLSKWANSGTTGTYNSQDFYIGISQTRIFFGYQNRNLPHGSSFVGLLSDYAFNLNKWYHIAVQRKSNKCYFYIDGVIINEPQDFVGVIGNTSTEELGIGYGSRQAPSSNRRSDFNISDLRITLGVARYSGTFIPQ